MCHRRIVTVVLGLCCLAVLCLALLAGAVTPRSLASPVSASSPIAGPAVDLEQTVMEQAAQALGCGSSVGVVGTAYWIRCTVSPGHENDARIERYASEADAQAALAQASSAGIPAQFHGYPAYTRQYAQNPGSWLPMNHRYHGWQAGRWLIISHAFDDTHYTLARPPEVFSEAIYQAAIAQGLFSSTTLHQMYLPLLVRAGSDSALPDLLVDSMVIEADPGVLCGDPPPPLGLTVHFSNISDGDAGLFVLDANGEELFLPGLAAHSSSFARAETYVAGGPNTAFIDSTGLVAESDETNNQLSQMLPIPTPLPPCTPTHTPTPTSTATNTPTATRTPSPTPTATATSTATWTPTISPTSTWTPSATPTRTPTPSPTRTATPTVTSTPTSTATATPTSTFTPTPTPTATPCNPWIEFTFVPAYGSTQDLLGRVGCVIPADHKVAVYIYVAGWWTKPYWNNPLTPIAPDGTWVTDITTGGNDPLATQIAAFLVPNGYSPPSLGGAPTLPPELFAFPHLIVERNPPRTINFASRTWYVKVANWNADPGPCYYSDRPEDVWVDASGRLHLTLTYRNYRWYCTEIFATQPSGYGVYSFDLASRVDQLDRNVVLGLFTYDDTSSAYSHREIDIEFARWGVAGGPNAQYVVQPYTSPGHRHQFDLNLPSIQSTHTFTWTVGSAQFASYLATNPNTPLHAYSHVDSDIPPAGNGNPRINLWLYNGAVPSNGVNVEVIIESFTFAPAVQ